MVESWEEHIPCSENVADLMMKVINGQKREYLVNKILDDIYGDH